MASTYEKRSTPAANFDDVPLEWAKNEYVLRFWAPRHDELVKAAILRRGFTWPWRMTDELVAATSPAAIETWKRTDPLAAQYAWYNVLMYFAISRAKSLGLTALIPAPTTRPCRLCGQSFLDQSLPSPLVERLGLNRLHYCAPCLSERLLSLGNSTGTKEAICDYLLQMSQLIERIPNQGFGRGKTDLDGLPLERLDLVLRLLETKPSLRRINRLYGSWLAALVASGVLPDGTRPMRLGTMTLAEDGHVCRSLAEKTVDDWLSRKGIPHEREPRYEGTNYRADWEVRGFFVEYFGLMGASTYAARAAEKKVLAARLARGLIELFPEDLAVISRLEKKMDEALK